MKSIRHPPPACLCRMKWHCDSNPVRARNTDEDLLGLICNIKDAGLDIQET